MANFVVSGTPHVRSKESIQSIMRDVIIALVPATAAGIYYFGLRALILIVAAIISAVFGKAIGTTAMVVPLTFAAAPYVARMVESSIKEVPFGVIEAAQSMGASPWQIVWKVLVPEAKPSLMVGGAISIVTILGYSAMAGFIGGGGLGTVAVNYGYNRYNFPIMLIAVIIIVVVVQIFQEVGMRLAHRLDKRNR